MNFEASPRKKEFWGIRVLCGSFICIHSTVVHVAIHVSVPIKTPWHWAIKLRVDTSCIRTACLLLFFYFFYEAHILLSLLQHLLNPEKTIENNLSWRKHVRLGLPQLRLMKMERKLIHTFLSTCHLHLGTLMPRSR